MTSFNNYKVILFFSFLSICFIILLSTLFFYELKYLQNAIKDIQFTNGEIIQKLILENSIQAEKILILENLVNSSKLIENSTVSSQYFSNLATFKILLTCLSVIILVIGGYYCFNIIFQKTIVAKILGGF